MSELTGAEQIDRSLDAMLARLKRLQPALTVAVVLGVDAYTRLMPGLPLAHERSDQSKMWHAPAFSAAVGGTVVSDLLIVKIDEDETLMVDRYMGRDINHPLWRITHHEPYGEGLVRATTINHFSEFGRTMHPNDVEVSIYQRDPWRHIDFIGYEYTGIDPYIARVTGRIAEL